MATTCWWHMINSWLTMVNRCPSTIITILTSWPVMVDAGYWLTATICPVIQLPSSIRRDAAGSYKLQRHWKTKKDPTQKNRLPRPRVTRWLMWTARGYQGIDKWAHSHNQHEPISTIVNHYNYQIRWAIVSDGYFYMKQLLLCCICGATLKQCLGIPFCCICGATLWSKRCIAPWS